MARRRREDAAADGTKTVTVTSDSAKAGEAVLFGFGKIRFTDEDMNGAAAGQDGTRTKEFRYTVKENPLPDGKMTGVTIDGHEATLKITVSDNLEGKLEVTNIASENGTFTNEYKSRLLCGGRRTADHEGAERKRYGKRSVHLYSDAESDGRKHDCGRSGGKIRTCECGKYI